MDMPWCTQLIPSWSFNLQRTPFHTDLGCVFQISLEQIPRSGITGLESLNISKTFAVLFQKGCISLYMDQRLFCIFAALNVNICT